MTCVFVFVFTESISMKKELCVVTAYTVIDRMNDIYIYIYFI